MVRPNQNWIDKQTLIHIVSNATQRYITKVDSCQENLVTLAWPGLFLYYQLTTQNIHLNAESDDKSLAQNYWTEEATVVGIELYIKSGS